MTAALAAALIASIPAVDISGTITGEVVLPAGDHNMIGGVTVAAGATLRLQAGARLWVQGNYQLTVQGQLVAEGTAASPCQILSVAAAAGSWPGIYCAGGTILLTYCTLARGVRGILANGGSVSLSNCAIQTCTYDGLAVYGSCSLQVANCSFSGIDRYGIAIFTASASGSVGACQFDDVGSFPVLAKAGAVGVLQGPFTFVNCPIERIGVDCAADVDITADATWQWLGAEYDLTAGSSDELAIGAGATLVLAAGVRLRCGRIDVYGTLSVPGGGWAYLYGPSGEQASAGDWPGIYLRPGGAIDATELVVRNADVGIDCGGGQLTLSGCQVLNSLYDGIRCANDTQISIDGCQIDGAGRSGLRLIGLDVAGSVADTAVRNCGDYPIYAVANCVGVLGGGLEFESNARQAIGVNCANSPDITRSQTWVAQPVPYDLAADPSAVMAEVAAGARLDIGAGVRLIDGGVATEGQLYINGTADQPVQFSGTAAGGWVAIHYQAGSAGQVAWAEVSGAGTGIVVDGASPQIEHVQVTGCSGDGIQVLGGAAPVVVACTFASNGRYGIYVAGAGTAPNFGDRGNADATDDGYNQIFGNSGAYDFYNASPQDIKAEGNWWGTNQEAAIRARIRDSEEDPAAGTVDFEPYLLAAPNTPPELVWAGGQWEGVGVAPLVGTPSTSFKFRVVYRDEDGHPASFVKVHIYDGGEEIAGSPFELAAEDANPDWRNGAAFSISVSLAASRAYSYRFEASDGRDAATGEPTAEHAGPVVDTPPQLSWTGEAGYEADGVEPESGWAEDTEFVFRVKYSDAEGDAPSGVFVRIYKGGVEIPQSPVELAKVSGDYAGGAIYSAAVTLPEAGTDYTYAFAASDGVFAAEGEPTVEKSGPEVEWRPKLEFAGELGYVCDGVEPQAGAPGTTNFTFRVRYIHRGGVEPVYVRVHVLLDGNEVAGSPFGMSAVDASPVESGRLYQVQVALPSGRDYEHYFEAFDGVIDAFGPATEPAPGPVVDNPPVLEFVCEPAELADGLDPNSGQAGGTAFLFRVRYRDPDGDPPTFVGVRIFRDGQEIAGSPFDMQAQLGADWAEGKVFELRKRLGQAGSYSYQFCASDGVLEATGPGTAMQAGPSVGGVVELYFPDVPGFADDGVVPDYAADDAAVEFRVVYRHGQGTAPAYVRLKLRRADQPGSVASYDMQELDQRPYDEGRTYAYRLQLSPDVDWSYWFEASDGAVVVRTDELSGPVVNRRPELSWVGDAGYEADGVEPNSGTAGQTVFVFRVLYRDGDGDWPQRAEVHIYTSPTAVEPAVELPMEVEAGDDPAEGVIYRAQATLGVTGALYTRFAFADARLDADGEPATRHQWPDVGSGATGVLQVTSVRGGGVVAVEVAASPAPAGVWGEVMNIAGRPIARVSASEGAEAGRYSIVWGCCDAGGRRVPRGIYLLKVTARWASGAEASRIVPVSVER